MRKYRIKEYTNKEGYRIYQIQEKRWLFWLDCAHFGSTVPYIKHSLRESKKLLKEIIAREREKIENKTKKTKYHYVEE